MRLQFEGARRGATCRGVMRSLVTLRARHLAASDWCRGKLLPSWRGVNSFYTKLKSNYSNTRLWRNQMFGVWLRPAFPPTTVTVKL